MTSPPNLCTLKANNIQDIVDEKIKEKLIDFIAKEKGKKFEEIMQDFAAKEWTGKANKGKGKKYHITKVYSFGFFSSCSY